MKITIETNDPAEAQRLLAALSGGDFPTDTQRAAAEESTGATPSGGAAKKAAAPAAKKAAAKKAAEPEPEAPADEPEEEPDEVVAMREEATSKASALMANGERPKVLAALREIGSERVRDLPADRLQEFMDLLDAED